jgi:hypothetical protein
MDDGSNRLGQRDRVVERCDASEAFMRSSIE